MSLRGTGRQAGSLGPDDPRGRRLMQSLADPSNIVEAPIVVGPSGKITLAPATFVGTPTVTLQSGILDLTTGSVSSSPATLNPSGTGAVDDNFATLAAEFNNALARVDALEVTLRGLVRALKDARIVSS